MIIILNMYENNERTAQNPMVFCHFFHENCMSFNFWNNRIGGSLILNLFFSINWKFFHVKFSKARAQGLPAKWNTCTTLVYKYVSCDICKCATKKKWIQLSLAIYVNVTLRKNGFNSLSLSLSLSYWHKCMINCQKIQHRIKCRCYIFLHQCGSNNHRSIII